MSIISKAINIDLSHNYANVPIMLHEGDVDGTSVQIAVRNNNVDFDLTGCTVKYDAVIAGYLAESDHSATYSGSVITIPITSNMTALSGILKIDVKILKNDETLFFPTLEAKVQRRIIDGQIIIDISGTTIEQRFEALEARFPVQTADIADGAVTSDKIGTGAVTARKIAPGVVPTKTSDLTNDSGFLTQHQDISGKEDVANKVTALSAASTDAQYPSAKCVYGLIGNVESLLAEV